MGTYAPVTCTQCAVVAEVAAYADYAALWDCGWRWIGTQELFSCPACPPVIVVDQDGRHRRGPGADLRPLY